MNTQPLLFLGEKRRDAVTERAGECLRRWRQQWSREAAESFEVNVEPPKAGGFTGHVAGAATHCWALELGAQRLAVLLLPHSTFTWAVLEGNAMVVDSLGGGESPLTAMLEQEAALSLLTAICLLDRREAVTASRLPADTLGDWSRDARAWTFHARATASGRGCTVLLAASRVEMLAPARTPVSARALDSRRDAIGSNTVAVRAVVGEASMPVSELAELALDDVLILDQPLTEPVALIAPDSGFVFATGNLGRAGARRAIKLAAVPAQKN
jgi:flagellar motor switch/type III secretory pathway protein FliN